MLAEKRHYLSLELNSVILLAVVFCAVGANDLDDRENFLIQMDMLTPLVGHPFYTRCTLRVVHYEEMNLQRITRTVDYFIGNSKACTVDDWKNCNITQLWPTDKSCHCSSFHRFGEVVNFRYYFYIAKILSDYKGRTVKCRFGEDIEDSRIMEVIGFSMVPERHIFNCSGGEVIFNWGFQSPLGRDSIRDQFQLMTVEWFHTDTDDNEEVSIACFDYRLNRSIYYDDHGTGRSKVLMGGTLKRLLLFHLSAVDNGVIRIKVTFDRTKYRRQEIFIRNKRDHGSLDSDDQHSGQQAYGQSHKNIRGKSQGSYRYHRELMLSSKLNAINDPDFALFPHAGDSQGLARRSIVPGDINETLARTGLEFNDTFGRDLFGEDDGNFTTPPPETYRPPIKVTTVAIKKRPTTIRAPPVTTPESYGPTTTEPPLPEYIEDKTTLTVTSWPSRKLDMKISGTSTLTGNLIITCEINTDHTGTPPANTTIWHNDQVLTTRVVLGTLGYSQPTARDDINFSCGLQGYALLCLPADDPRIRPVFLRAEDITYDETGKGGIDYPTIIYGAEFTASLLLLFWTITLILDHLKAYVSQRQAALEEMLELEEQKKEVRRKQYYMRLGEKKQKPRRQIAV